MEKNINFFLGVISPGSAAFIGKIKHNEIYLPSGKLAVVSRVSDQYDIRNVLGTYHSSYRNGRGSTLSTENR